MPGDSERVPQLRVFRVLDGLKPKLGLRGVRELRVCTGEVLVVDVAQGGVMQVLGSGGETHLHVKTS